MTVRAFLYSFFTPWLPVLREERTLPQWVLTSSLLILAVLLVRALLRDKISLRARYALWAVVLLRLLVPVQLPLDLPGAPARLVEELPYQLTYPTVSMYPAPGAPDAVSSEMYRSPDDSTQATFIQTLPDGERISVAVPIWSRYQVILTRWWGGVLVVTGAVTASNLHFYRQLKKRRASLNIKESHLSVYVAEGLPSSCLFGVFHPCIYLTPEAAADEMALRHVLAHELTHRAHWDHIWSLLRCFALALHWYNPLVWLAAVLSKRDGELACDEGAVARLGEAERIPYGRTLVDMVAARSGGPADLLSCSTAMMGGKKSIQQRVALLIKRPETAKTALFLAVSAVSLTAVFVFAGRSDNDPKMFLSQLERAESIRYFPPLYSSLFYAAPIADEDLLAQAKAVLSDFTYLSDDDPQPDLTDWISLRRITLSFDSKEMKYTLLWQNDRTYLFSGGIREQSLDLKEEQVEYTQFLGDTRTRVSETGVNAASILEDLARRQMNRDLYSFSLTDVSSYYEQYHRQLSAAQGMGCSSPMLHNHRIITDPDQLKQARELLALEPLTEEEIFRQWDGVWNDMIYFNSNIPTPDWTGADDSSPAYYVSWEDGCYYILLPTQRKEGELNSGIYLGKLSEENWSLADELFEQAPSVDDRLYAAGLASGRYTVAIDEHPEAMEALTQLFVNDEFFLSQNARTHDTAPENIAAWLSGRGSELIAPEIYVVGFNPWTLSAFGDGSLLFIDLSIPDHLTALVEDICQSSGIIPSV